MIQKNVSSKVFYTFVTRYFILSWPFLIFLFLPGYVLKSCLVSGYVRRISKPVIRWNENIRSIVPDEFPIREYMNCGGKITKGPGIIRQFFQARQYAKNVHCMWRIHTPENYHVYVKQMRITRTTLHNADAKSYDDAPFVQIYDGTETTDENRLFKFDDATLNRCLSYGQDLTIDLRYEESGKHIDHEVTIKYGFIEHLKAEVLLP